MPQPVSKPMKVWKHKKTMVDKKDVLFRGAMDGDIIIPIMGPTGSGKSTFINAVLDQDVVDVCHDLESGTKYLEPVVIDTNSFLGKLIPGRLILVDTPGFGDTYENDAEILRRISVWLGDSYHKSMKVAGVIYLHNLTEPRMLGAARKNLGVFENLCGPKNMGAVHFITTRWQDMPYEVALARENQLKSKYWSSMVKEGARVARFNSPTHERASKIIKDIMTQYTVNHSKDWVLTIQKELIDHQKLLGQTNAGKTVRKGLVEELEKQKRLFSMREEEFEGREFDSDTFLLELRENGVQMQKLVDQAKELKIGFGTRIRSFFHMT